VPEFSGVLPTRKNIFFELWKEIRARSVWNFVRFSQVQSFNENREGGLIRTGLD
jgi:hypothetical protein